MKTKPILLIFLLLQIVVAGWGQRTITGVVIDDFSREPLIGASIIMQTTNDGAVTDFYGKFTLILPDSVEKLNVVYSCYRTDTVEIRNIIADSLEISLQEDLTYCTLISGISCPHRLLPITDKTWQPLPFKIIVEEVSRKYAISTLKMSNKEIEQPSYHPYQLLQSRIPGLQISQPGSDPNGNFTARIRGLNSLYQNSNPLIIIDDVPALSIDQIDPENIATIEVLRDVASSARYGIRGAGGVIKIMTKRANVYSPLRVQLHSFVGTENITRRLPFASGADFIRAGGTDLGSTTNWLDEITDAAFSQAHHLSFTGNLDQTNTHYRVGLTYRNANGLLRNSGLQRTGARVHLRQDFFRDKLNIQLKGAVLQTDRLLGVPAAFRYAHIYNPTAPIFGKDDLSEQYGGYFQQPIFDYFNPVAIVEQTINNATERMLTGNVAVNYKLFDYVKISLLGSQNSEQQATYFASPAESYFNNFNGLSQQRNFTQNVDNQFVKANVNYANGDYYNKFKFYANAGYDAQWITRQSLNLNVIDAAVGTVDFTKLATAQNFFTENTTLFAPLRNALGNASDYHERQRLIAFYGDAQIEWQNKVALTASLRREGSSRLGENGKWGWFPSVSAMVNVAQLFDIRGWRELNVRGNYGVTGGLPVVGGLSIAPVEPQGEHFYNGRFQPILNLSRNANPSLTYERTRGVNFGLDIQNQKRSVALHLDWYQQQSDNLLEWVFVESPPFLRTSQYQNSGAVRNRGVEMALEIQLVENYNFSWKTQLNFATNQSTLIETGRERFDRINLIRSLSERVTYSPELVGEPIGTIIAPILANYTDDVRPTFVEQDPQVGFSTGIENAVPVGNLYPKADLGWYNEIKWNNFALNFLLRGTFGHQMINANRIFYEVGEARNLNILQTKYAPPSHIRFQFYHDEQVENASFIRLDNIALSYRIEPKIGRLKYKIYLAARNLFTITGYTGNDPELRLEDTYYNFYYSNTGTSYAPQPRDLRQAGIDVRNTYYLARTLILGVRVLF